MKISSVVAIIVALCAAVACNRASQSPGDLRPSTGSCWDGIPAAEMLPVPVYLRVSLIDSAPPQLANSADLFAQDVALYVQRMVTGQRDSLVSADAKLHPSALSGGLLVTIYKSKPLRRDTIGPRETWQVATEAIGSPRHPRAKEGARLISDAFDSVRAQGEPFFVWPNYPPTDSLRFILQFSFDPTASPNVWSGRPRFPLFLMTVPREKPPILVRGAEVIYPSAARSRGVQANIMLQFVVDTNGRADPATVMHRWPDNVPPLTGEAADYYAAFVKAAKQNALESRYRPATVGGCPVRARVQVPYIFEMSK